MITASGTSPNSVRSAKSPVSTRIIDGFEDPTFGREEWQTLLQQGVTDSVFLTWHFQRAWWETLGRGKLLLIVAERNDNVVALAPFYIDSQMVYFLGTGFESDCLDFIGDVRDPEVLDALLDTARAHTPNFEGFKFYFIPEKSETAKGLAEAAERLDLSCYEEGAETAPYLDMAGHSGLAMDLANKKRLLKYERFFCENGGLTVQHLREGHEIAPYLDELCEQHIARWEGGGNPSRFLDPRARRLIERLPGPRREIQSDGMAGALDSAASWLLLRRPLYLGHAKLRCGSRQTLARPGYDQTTAACRRRGRRQQF